MRQRRPTIQGVKRVAAPPVGGGSADPFEILSFQGNSLGANLPTRMAESAGTTHYISPSGNDTTGDGTSGAPWRTPKKALATVSAGAIIEMAAGDYPSPYSVQKVVSASTPITFKPADGLALGDIRWLWSFRVNTSTGLRFIGIEFFFDNGCRTTTTSSVNTGATTVPVADLSAFPTSTADGALNPGVRHCGIGNTATTGTESSEKNHFTYGSTPSGNTFTSVAGWIGSGLTYNSGSTVAYGDVGLLTRDTAGACTDIEFHYCDIHHASESNLYSDGGERIHYVNCIIRDAGTREDAKHARDHGGYLGGTDVLLVNCEIRDNDAHGFQLYPNGSGRMAVNCTIDGNGLQHATGLPAIIIAGDTASNERVINNIVTNNGGTGYQSNLGTGHIVKYNLFFGNDGADSGGSIGVTYTAHPNNGQDPDFTNYGSKDFTLQASSPALASGDPDWAPQFDARNELRPSSPSVGAYEEA
jgi:hypothetical protein